MVLRYEPSFEAESQIVIFERAGKIYVIRYTAIDGNILSQLNEIL